ncbi:asparaginase [Gordoniibacillus kamchatkensis]|uniref:Asparaginase n=1 Tax=Gordoniibacillus kamchatkensis TaxID=1590651 RepID=A0ABR5AJJ6_9BACL|nr:asparaginase [Paenibacillus sp. VKM B-2647]KIL41151.1 asparaginase [Paenibacillus sp. VKM B-2647]
MVPEAERLVAVTRGPLTECVHRGHVAVADANGRLLYYAGDPAHVTFARSSAKPLQALPVLESGAADAFAMTDPELALLCASHNGEETHVQTAQTLLSKMGLSGEHLQCGAHYPFHRQTAQAMRRRGEQPTNLHNNCSGKHSGMLALALMLGADIAGYLAPEHPVQRRMLAAVSEMSGVPESDIAIGVDGCGVPVFGMPLAALAAAYARFGRPDGQPEARRIACERLMRAIVHHPDYLAGDDRYDTQLVRATSGRLIGKMGAEGVFAIAVPERGWGIAVKIEDGAQRALYPAATEALRQLGLLSDTELAALAKFHRPLQHNWQGTEVGAIVPEFQLRPAAG